LHGKLDADGKTRLELTLPKQLYVDEAQLELSAEIVGTADQRATAEREALVSASELRMEITPESRALVPGVQNRVWVAITDPQGAPLANRDVELISDGKSQSGRTDAIGVAQFTADARTHGIGCNLGETRLVAGVRREGVVQSVSRCVPLAATGFTVRTDRAIYPANAPITVDVDGLGADGLVYVDVVKDAQTIDTAQVMLVKGHGQA